MNCMAFVFPAIRGVQAGRDYYVSMVPLEVIPRIFQFSDENLSPENRSQRVLKRSRIPEIRDYILNNPDSYVFSSLTVSVDGDIQFVAAGEKDSYLGYIEIPMNARFLINDGQHRQAAIEEAVKKNPSLKDEHISVVFFRDEGLLRSQQMFSDLNRFAIRPTKSINILFNSREESSVIAKKVVERVSAFKDHTEKEKTTLSNRSKALFTLSAICTATEELLKGMDKDTESKTDLAVQFWTQVASHIPEWNEACLGRVKASELRRDSICTFSITLIALGYGGNALIKESPERWEQRLSALDGIDWGKRNPAWDKLVFINGKVAANRSTQRAMSSYMRSVMTGNAGGNDV